MHYCQHTCRSQSLCWCWWWWWWADHSTDYRAVKFVILILIKMRRNSGGENWGMKQTHFCFINLLIIHHNCQFPPLGLQGAERSTASREVFKIVKLTMLGRGWAGLGWAGRLNRIPIECCDSYIFTEYFPVEILTWARFDMLGFGYNNNIMETSSKQ